ncbi:MAG: acyl-phosphate glycerol 3-phosphate acyltransferase [Rubrivirga sp.]|nr:acyl-phosphate glycerol 3-phosphate acyltransferase [Rubrivirga sp.]
MSSPSRGQNPSEDVGSGRQPVARSAPGGSLTGRALILFTVLGLLVVALSVPVRNWLAQRTEVASLRSDIASSTEQIELLNSELGRWSDPAFISSEARRRLHFLLPGETGYITISRDGRPAESLLSDDLAQIPQGWHSVLWESVQRADGPPAVSPKPEDGA